jgi:thiamine biosynthesis protein ThiS
LTVTIDYNERGNIVSIGSTESAGSKTVEIVVNGVAKRVPKGLKLDQLLVFLEVDPSRVAVERNREIARKASWSETVIEAGDSVEVVWFVGGG